MKILYAFQGTGNGHIARAQEIIPILKKYAKVDTLISGHQSQLQLEGSIDFHHQGVSLLYNAAGGISYRKIILQNNFLNAIKDINSMNLKGYDLIINDFEPLTAWACKVRNLRMLELSHQASMSFKETPKPEKKDFLGEMILKYYAPSDYKIGFHFENYHLQIKKPVIRKKIRNLNPDRKGFYIVYLPSFSDENILKILHQIPVEWKIFSRCSSIIYTDKNVDVYPVDEVQFLKYFENCEGILCNAGFEGPAEALFMEKKLFVIPIRNQYEQECNAEAMRRMGIPNSKSLNVEEIKNWVSSSEILKVDYPDEIESIIVNEVLTC
ncbi:MAG: glycosyl transferase [Chryseobacterium sp.]|nr:glycosyl transferase [Chryseobacterium sp.]